jgi:hypothetical protein
MRDAARRSKGSISAIALAWAIVACTERSPAVDVAPAVTPVGQRPSQGGVPKQVISTLQAAGVACKAAHPELAGRGMYMPKATLSTDQVGLLQLSVEPGTQPIFDACLVDEVRKSHTTLPTPIAGVVLPLGFSL